MTQQPRPLDGRRIVVTRSPQQASKLADPLQALGANPIIFPVIRFEPIHSDQLQKALNEIESYDWLLFTSVNAVNFFMAQANDRKAIFPRIAAVGSATADKLASYQLSIDFIPDEFVGEKLVEGLGDLAGKKILLPRAKIGRPEITRALNAKGGTVSDIPLYDTITATPSTEAKKALQDRFDVISFTSPSSVRNFLKIIDDQLTFLRPQVNQAKIACIGPVTADEVEKQGLTVTATPSEYTIEGLIEIIKNMNYEV